jgi:hypothetical protein
MQRLLTRGLTLALLFAFSGWAGVVLVEASDASAAPDGSHRRLTDAQAVRLTMESFGSYLREAESSTLEPMQIERFVSDYAAVVSGEEGLALVESSIPLRTLDGDGPVDLDLRQGSDGLRPKNPLVPVNLPIRLGEGLSLPSYGVRIELPDADPEVAPSVAGPGAAIYPNVERGVSLAAVPLPTGLETFSVLHSAAAPRVQSFDLQLPAGATLESTPEGGAEVLLSGRALISVPAPTAIDAEGSPVETTLAVNGETLRVQVSPSLGTAYPILVDPIYQTYNWISGVSTGLSDWVKTSNTSAYTAATQLNCGTNCVSPFEKSGTPGLYVGATSGVVSAGSTAYWSYFVPRYQSDKSKYGQLPTSFISSAELSSVMFFHRSDAAASPALFAGLWSSAEAPYWGGPNYWASQVIRYGNQPDWTGASISLANESGNQATKWLLAGLAATDSHSVTSYRDAYFGAAKIALSDTGKPVLSGITAPTGWFDQMAAAPIPATAEDSGLGVASFTSKEVVKPFNSWEYSLGCPGTASNPCPRVWNSSEGSPTLLTWPSALPEGIDKLAVTVSDPVGNVSETSYIDVKIDHSAPLVTLSGPLTNSGPKRLDPGKYSLHVDATDGSVGSPRSGVRSIAIEVDGKVVPGTVEQSCPGGSCSASRDWTFDVASYSNGEHIVTVTVKDQVGRQAKSELKVTVDKSRLYWGARMDGDVQLLKSPPQPPLGDAPWDQTTWNEFESDAGGKTVSIVHFGQPAPWQQEFAKAPLDYAYERDAIPLMSMGSGETSLEKLANGEGKEYEDLLKWIAAVKNYGKPFFFRWNWEMNLRPNDELPWTKQIAPNPKLFVEAWRKFRKVADEKGATNITWVWCPNTSYGTYPEGSTPLSELWPGGEYVDWTCIDGYNRGTNLLQPEGWKRFSEVFKKTYNEVLALAPSKPLMIGETASTESGGSKASWIASAITQEIPLEFPKIKALVWFNWNIEKEPGSRWDWPIESSTAAKEAFASAIGSPNYAPGEFESLPALTRVQPLP